MKVVMLVVVSQKIDDLISYIMWDIRVEDFLEKKIVINQVECFFYFN